MKPIQNISKDPIARGGVDDVKNPTFTEASERTNIVSEESIPTLFGKIKKWFTDLKTVAFTNSYTDLDNKPTIPAAQIQSDWNQTTTTAKDYIKNKPTIPAAQVQTDWNATSGMGVLLNKPTIPTNTNQLTNGAGFITSSGSCASATKATQDGSGNTITSTYAKKAGDKFSGEVIIDFQNGGADNNDAWSKMSIGNNIPKGTAKHSAGYVRFWGHSSYYTDFYAPSSSDNRDIQLPNKNGTVALTSDIPTVNNATLTINQGGTSKGTFTANASSNVTIDLTDNNNAVTQTATSTNANYEVLFSATADNTTRTEGARKYSNLKFNPSTGNLQATQLNGVTIGSSPKFTDTNTTYSAGTGISLSGTTFSNSGVRSIATGSSNGTISVNTNGTSANVAVKGLGTAAYTASTAYAAASHTHDTYLPKAGGTMTGTLTMGTNLVYSASTLNLVGSKYLNLRSPGIQCRSENDNAWTGISMGSATFKYGDTAAGSVSVQSDGITYSEDRGNGFCVRADSGIWVRPRGTGLSFKPVAASAFNVNSSRRYKENINPLTEEEAKKILDVETVTFDYKNKEDSNSRDVYDQKGVIAEQVESIIPYAVTLEKVDGEEVPGFVDYSKFVPYLIKMCQIQQNEINELREIINSK